MTAQGNGGRGSQEGRASVAKDWHMRNNNQRGIVIGPILFIVAILAVLASAIAAGAGAFNGDISAVKAKAQASAILEYAESVKMGVDRVLGKGCTDTQVSFENPIVSGYENPNAPSDKSCHVFDQNGGGIVWKNAPEEVYFDNGYGQWKIVTGTANSFRYLGTQEHDLFLVLGGTISHANSGVVAKGKNLLSVCKEINKMLGIGSSGSGMDGFFSYESNGPLVIPFQGNFQPSTGTWEAESMMKGRMSLCAANPAPGYFGFMKVLIVR